MRHLQKRAAALAAAMLTPSLHAAGIPAQQLDPVEVEAAVDGLQGRTESATIGIVFPEQFEHRPMSRPGELLEVVPGLIVTQHSGEGKANQYFLRGFNLDHGTDFATWLDGMPVNMPTHGHGQGYTDLGFLIPELVESIEYRKGPYYASVGDFSSAGAAALRYRSRLDGHRIDVTAGGDEFYRVLASGSPDVAGGRLVYGIEGESYAGPWVRDQNYQKANGVLRYVREREDGGWHLSLMGYDAGWDATDQIPLRAVQAGTLDRLGNIDDTVGGESSRYSLSGGWHRDDAAGGWRASAYAVRYRMDLYSNFTYFLDDPVNGDQFEQYDERMVYGGSVARRLALPQTLPGNLEFGLQLRHDDIEPVGLYRSRARQRLSTVREDAVKQTSAGVYAQADLALRPWLRVLPGLRYDRYEFDVDSALAANSGSAGDGIASPKLGLVFGPLAQTEFFINAGRGFHSNDGRGTTITIDPSDGVTPADPVDPLVPTRGLDLGLRTAAIPQVQLALSVFALDIDSELLFIGDGGSTEATRPSERRGVELAAYWRPLPSLIVDADLAWTRARFADSDPAGDRIPGAVEGVAAAGIAWESGSGFDASLRLRHFGPRPLIEDDSVRSEATTLVNAALGYRFASGARLALEAINLFDSRDDDITYFYESQLAGEGAPVADRHFHPVEPFTLRLRAAWTF